MPTQRPEKTVNMIMIDGTCSQRRVRAAKGETIRFQLLNPLQLHLPFFLPAELHGGIQEAPTVCQFVFLDPVSAFPALSVFIFFYSSSPSWE